MNDPNNNPTSTEAMLKQFVESASSLKKEVTELKKQDSTMWSMIYPQKRPCNGGNFRILGISYVVHIATRPINFFYTRL